MLKISACVIVKNEEKNIPTWLACMKKIANEMIVVDTGSADATVKLAKDGGAQVYDYKWDNDFSAAKNFALDQAKGNWIIFLDADEYFPEEMADNVISAITQVDSNQNIDGLICPLINIDVDKENSFISEIQSLRIFRHQSTLRFQGNVHVKDTVGAGDAFYSLAVLAAANKLSIDRATLISNVAGAIKTNLIGNSSPIKKVDLLKFISTILNV